jgi:KUP system potassium uptake protein
MVRNLQRSRVGLLALGALGVVLGDIGTSPLYAFSEIFMGAHTIPVVEGRVLGALSMIFWTLTLVVSVKYVVIVMRAGSDGEGGVMALASMASMALRKHRTGIAIMVFGVIGAALFYGDGIITPALSVLSAVEGIEVVAPALGDFVVPIALVILVVLFLMQRYGTGRVGKVFGPVMLLWFFVIALLGIFSVVQTPEVLRSLNPVHAVGFFQDEPLTAFLALGSVVLCVTGAEALFADMGQFGQRPIRISWFAVAAPSLYFNYLGQGALVLRDPTTVDNSFYLLVPSALLLPMVLLATAATIIASQAVISGAFSMTQQAIELGYLPRMTIRHTSASQGGQIYVPLVNWLLCLSVIAVVLGFQSSSNLASAYGIAVTGTFVITTCLIAVVARKKWNIRRLYVYPIFIFFLLIDVSFFIANLTKFTHGGWFPLAVAVVLVTILLIWQWGSRRLKASVDEIQIPLDQLPAVLGDPLLTKIPGTAVYITLGDGVPISMVQRIKLLRVIEVDPLILQVHALKIPRVDDAERIRISDVGVIKVDVQYGFMEIPDLPRAMRLFQAQRPDIDVDTCTYLLHDFRVVHESRGPIRRIVGNIFTLMQRNSTDPLRYFQLPANRVVEFDRLVEI